MAISLTEPVFLRSSREFCRVICVHDHFVFPQEAAEIFEEKSLSRLRPGDE